MRRVKTPTAAGKYDRGYMSVSIEGGVYYALYESGATCCVTRPALGERFKYRLKPSSSRIHAIDGEGSDVLGTLPVMLEIDGVCKNMKSRVLDAVDQPMILGMDFGRAFAIETEWHPQKWGRQGGRRSGVWMSATDRGKVEKCDRANSERL